MAWGNINLGNLADALSISGADPDYVDQLRREQALRDMSAQESVPAAIASNPFDASSPDVQRALSIAGQGRDVPSPPPAINPVNPQRAAIAADFQRQYPSNENLGAAPVPRFSATPAPDVNTALARTGSGYRLPEAEQQPAAVPAAQPGERLLPENIDAALARTGSQYRPTQPPTFNPQASTQALQARATQNVNDQIADDLALGDVKAQQHADSAKLYREDAVSGQMRTDELQQRRDAAMARKDANTEEAYKALRSMQQQLGSPPDTSKGRALQIIGTVLSMTPRGGGIGRGLSMLGQMMGDDVQRWAAGVEGSDKLRNAFLEMNRHENMGMESELHQEATLSNIVAANTLNSLKAAEEDAGSEEAKAVARKLARGVEDQAISHQLDIRGRREKELGQLQEDTVLTRALAQTPESDRPMVAAMYGPRGLEMLNSMNKPIAAQAELEGKRAQTSKTAAEAAEGPKLSDGERKTLRLFEGVAPSVDRIREMAATRGAPHPWSANAPDVSRSEQGLEDEAAIKNVSLALLRDESGAALPPAEQAEKRASWGIDSGDPKVRKNGLKLMLAEYDARRNALTRGRGGAAGAGNGAGGDMQYGTAGGLAPSSGGARGQIGGGTRLIDMVNPDTGQTARVAPDKIERAKALGFVVGRPSATEVPRDETPFRASYRQPQDAGVGAVD